PDGRGRYAEAPCDLTGRHPGRKFQTNNFAHLAHRNSLRWHRSLLWIAKGATLSVASGDARRLLSPRAGLSRSGGRHHIVLVGDIIPLRRARSSRFGGRLQSESALRCSNPCSTPPSSSLMSPPANSPCMPTAAA